MTRDSEDNAEKQRHWRKQLEECNNRVALVVQNDPDRVKTPPKRPNQRRSRS